MTGICACNALLCRIAGAVVTLVSRRALRAREQSRYLVSSSTALCWVAGMQCRNARDLKYDARALRIRHSAVRLARAS